MKETIKVMLVDDAEDIRETERKLLSYAPDIEIVAEAANGEEALEQAHAFHPDIVLMDINMPVLNGIQATSRIADELPGVSVIIVSVQEEFQSLKMAMQAGAKEYLLKPFTSDSMVAAIRNVHARGEKQQRVTTQAILTDRFRARSHVVGLMSAKGGVGKTTIAVNLAVALAERGKRVALIDLDLAFGDVGILLGAKDPQRNIYSLMLEGDDYTDALPRYMVQHDSGVMALTAPEMVEQGEYITPAYVQGLIRALRKEFDYVILDTAPLMQDLFFTAVEASDELLMVTVADLPSVKNNRRMINVLQTLGYDLGKVRSVYVRKGSLSERSAQEVLGLETYITVAFDSGAIGQAADLGIPFVKNSPHIKAARDIVRLANRLTAGERRVTREQDKGGVLRKMMFGMR